MSSAAYAGLVTLPVVITEPGDYITRSGERVTITRVSGVSDRHDHGCWGRYLPDGPDDSWHKSGRLYFSMTSGNDIISKAPA